MCRFYRRDGAGYRDSALARHRLCSSRHCHCCSALLYPAGLSKRSRPPSAGSRDRSTHGPGTANHRPANLACEGIYVAAGSLPGPRMDLYERWAGISSYCRHARQSALDGRPDPLHSTATAAIKVRPACSKCHLLSSPAWTQFTEIRLFGRLGYPVERESPCRRR